MKWVRVITAFLCIFGLTGCWELNELEEQAYVVIIGIDKGTHSKLRVTYQIANPQAGLPKGGNVEKVSDIVTFDAPDFLTVRDLANTSVARQITYSHTKVIVIGEEFARSRDFFPMVSAAIRDREIRREVTLIVSKEPAYEFIRGNQPQLETRAHKFYDYMSVRWRETGLVPVSTLQRLMQRMEINDDAFLAIYATAKNLEDREGNEDEYTAGHVPKKGGNPTQVIGSAIFSDGKMKGILSGEETRISLQLREQSLAKVFLSTFPDPEDPKNRIGIRFLRYQKTKVTVNTQSHPVHFQVTVPLEMELLYVPSQVNYITDLKAQQKLVTFVEKGLRKKVLKFVRKTQKELKADPFNWSYPARRKFLTVKQFEEWNWKEAYSTATVDVRFQLKLQNIGKQLDPPKIGE